MSQYVPGAIDYIPVIQPYKPNLNFFQKVLETKQAQYNAGYDQLSGLYGTLLESPMLKSENIEARNKFFNDISAQITKISSLDLSKQQNVDAASKVFQPLIDNDYIMKDMAYTKKYQQALDRHEYFKNCLDEKNCGGKYWEDGLRFVEYQAEDFVNASLEESLGFANPEYVPYTNAVEKAVKFAKEMGFKMQNIQQDGRYNLITENGAAIAEPLSSFLINNYKNDGNVQRVYSVLSYLQRKDYSKANAEKFNNSEAEAEKYYLDNMNQYINATSQAAADAALTRLELSKNKQNAIVDILEHQGVDPDDPKDQALINTAKQSVTDQLIAQGSADFYQQANEITDPISFKDSDMNQQRNRIDNAAAYSLFAGDMYDAALQYGVLTQKIVKFDADPYALAAHNSSLSLRNSLALEDARFGHEKELLRLQGKLVNPETNNEQLLPLEPTPGSTDKDANDFSSEQKREKTIGLEVGATAQQLANTAASDLRAIINAPINSVVNGIPVTDATIVQAKQELVSLLGSNEPFKPEISLKVGLDKHLSETAGKYTEDNSDKSIWETILDAGKNMLFSAGAYVFDQKELGNRLNPLVPENFLPPVTATLPQKSSEPTSNTPAPGTNGYLNPDLSVMTLTDNPKFFDPYSDMHYEKLMQKMATALTTDGSLLGKMVNVDGTPKYRQLIERSSQALAEKQIEADRIGFNTNLIISNNPFAMGIDINETSNPDIAREMFSKIAVGSGDKKHIASKQAWVAEYVEKQKTVTNPGFFSSLWQSMKGEGRYWGATQQADPEDVREEAIALYDQYLQNFQEEYNRGPGAIQKYVGFKPALAIKVGSGGSGVTQNPFMIQNIDTRYPGGGGAIGFTQTMDDFSRAMSNPEFNDRMSVFAGDVGRITDIKEATGHGIQKRYLDILSALDFEMNKVNKSKSDKGYRFNMSTFPIVGGDADYIGIKIDIDPMFAQNEKGTAKSLGLTGEVTDNTMGIVNSVNIVMPREAISPSNALFKALDETTDDRIMAAYGKLDIDYGPKFGKASLISSGNGYEYTFTQYDPYGKEISTTGYLDGSSITPGQFGTQARAALGVPSVYDQANQIRNIKIKDKATINQMINP